MEWENYGKVLEPILGYFKVGIASQEAGWDWTVFIIYHFWIEAHL